MSQVNLTLEDGNLVLKTPYDAGLVADLKASIPNIARRWEPKRKVWIIAYMHGQDIVDVVQRNLSTQLAIPKQHTSVKPKVEIKLLKIEYIGSVKEREDGSLLAFAYCENDWSVVLSLKALREWFEMNGEIKPDEQPTLYAVLGVQRKATDKEIKIAYRIAARTWHPDVNDEDTTNQFRRVQEAYEVLRDSALRRKYNAGLYLQSQVSERPTSNDLSVTKYGDYKPPKRCGYVTAEGITQMGRFVVSHILRWDEIIENGMVMVSYWPKGGKEFTKDWI